MICCLLSHLPHFQCGPASASVWLRGCRTPTLLSCCRLWKSWWSSWRCCPKTWTTTALCWRSWPLLWLPYSLPSLSCNTWLWGTSISSCRDGNYVGDKISVEGLFSLYYWVCVRFYLISKIWFRPFFFFSPEILKHEMKVFFVKYNDPIYVKLEKLDIMIRLASQANIAQVTRTLLNVSDMALHGLHRQACLTVYVLCRCWLSWRNTPLRWTWTLSVKRFEPLAAVPSKWRSVMWSWVVFQVFLSLFFNFCQCVLVHDLKV